MIDPLECSTHLLPSLLRLLKLNGSTSMRQNAEAGSCKTWTTDAHDGGVQQLRAPIQGKPARHMALSHSLWFALWSERGRLSRSMQPWRETFQLTLAIRASQDRCPAAPRQRSTRRLPRRRNRER